MTDWLAKDYVLPDKTNGYMKLKIGENRIRILTSPIIGYIYWVDEEGKRKPIRLRPEQSAPSEYAEFVKHFWAMVVWDYESKQIKILELTQKGIMKTLAGLARNSKWGSPVGYDILIERTGEGLETEYTVTPEPKEELSPDIKKAFEATTINLEALYDSGDPFASPSNSDGKDSPAESMDDLPFP